jgi:hypothetical protein
MGNRERDDREVKKRARKGVMGEREGEHHRRMGGNEIDY